MSLKSFTFTTAKNQGIVNSIEVEEMREPLKATFIRSFEHPKTKEVEYTGKILAETEEEAKVIMGRIVAYHRNNRKNEIFSSRIIKDKAPLMLTEKQ